MTIDAWQSLMLTVQGIAIIILAITVIRMARR